LWQYIGRVIRYLEENVIEDLENRSLEFSIVGDFLTDLKQEFGNRDNKLVKIAVMTTTSVKIKESGLDLFSFIFIFLFSIFRTTRVRVDQSYYHISHNLMV